MPATTIVHNDPYCRIELRDSDRTILAFSAINCPRGKFHGTRALKSSDCNLVFLNCPRNSWYVDGIPGLGDTAAEAAQGLGRLLAAHGLAESRLITWGGSMGGYGAVVFGALLGAEAIVATGAELQLLIPGGNSELVLKTLQKRDDVMAPDMGGVLAGSRARISLYAGEFFYPDLVSALQVADQASARITTLRDFGHPLPGYLHDTYGLGEFILHHLESSQPFPFRNGEIGGLAEFSDHWRTLHRASLGWCRQDAEVLLDLARSSPNDEWRMHCHHALSMGATAVGNHNRALLEAEQAMRAGPRSCFAAYRYALALRNAGRPVDQWLDIAKAIPNLHQPDRFSDAGRLLAAMVSGFVEAGKNDHGIRFLRHLMQRPETSAETRESLLGHIHILSGQEAWQVDFDHEAAAGLCGFLLDRNSVIARDGHVQISGVMVFPESSEPSGFLGDGLEILMIETGLPSPGFGKRLPDHPSAARARFRMRLLLGKQDAPSLLAKWKDGRSLPLLRLHRNSAHNQPATPG